jgi:hypothetical protein
MDNENNFDNEKKKEVDIEKLKKLSDVKNEIFRKYDLIMKLYNIYDNDIDKGNGMLNDIKNYMKSNKKS